MFVIKLLAYFFLWSFWSYAMHRLAHSRFRRFNFLRHVHLKHHTYDYGDSFLPPWHEYFFWFGNWRSSMDVYLTFTMPLVALAFFDPPFGLTLLVFHYFYELFLARNVLDHNPNIKGFVTRIIPIGAYHLQHHRNVRCNFAFYTTLWDRLFNTLDRKVLADRGRASGSNMSLPKRRGL